MSDIANCNEYESMERLDFPSSQPSSEILSLSIHQQDMSSLHINPAEMSSLPCNSPPQMEEILINNITIPDEMIEYDPTDSLVDGTSATGDGPLTGYEACVIGTGSDIHMDDIELQGGPKTNIFMANKHLNNQTHNFLVPTTIGDSQLVFFAEAGDDEMDGGGFQVIEASHIQVDDPQVQVEGSQVQIDDPQIQVDDPQIQVDDQQVQVDDQQVQVDNLQIQVDGSQLQMDSSQILISQEDLNDPDLVEEETVINIHSENIIKHSTINLQDLK